MYCFTYFLFRNICVETHFPPHHFSFYENRTCSIIGQMKHNCYAWNGLVRSTRVNKYFLSQLANLLYYERGTILIPTDDFMIFGILVKNINTSRISYVLIRNDGVEVFYLLFCSSFTLSIKIINNRTQKFR